MRTTALVRRQLAVMSVAAAICTVVLALTFMRLPEALGIHRYLVKADFPVGAGLYKGAQVTYLGTPVGLVSGMELKGDGVQVTLKLKRGTDIPADVVARAHSRSAVGEQYVDLVPPADASSRLLAAGQTIPRERTTVPVEIGPLLDDAYTTVSSIDGATLNQALGETSAVLDGRTNDIQTILDSGSHLLDTADANVEPTATLLHDAPALLSTVNGSAGHIRSLSSHLASVTAQLAASDKELRTFLNRGPAAGEEVTGLLDDLRTGLPPLLGPTNVILGVLDTYDAHLAGILAQYPRSLATVQSVTKTSGDDYELRLTLANADSPAECTQGFLPVNQWKGPFEQAPETTPLVYCQAARNDPRGVKGARNVPCPNAPTVRTGLATDCLARKK
ncbi:MAG: MCE family protein [Nocardioides sp.]|uniref:MCE family protein n=1 Tax=Nocardioides sp. TaxID=35761 RepID=UPI0039E5606E